MVDSGILREDDRVELIRGEIIEMSPIGTGHAACVKRLNKLLANKLGDRVHKFERGQSLSLLAFLDVL
nr:MULTISPECIES: Uma2 family endonuclease [unclassified Coleofasciculus]